MAKRVLIIALVASLVAVGATYVLQSNGDGPAELTQAEMAASIGSDVMRHLHRGHVPGRSGEVMLVPKPHTFLLGDWDLTTLASDRPTLGTSHPNPWAYLARVPIIVYGDGIPAGRDIKRSVDISQVAPSYARRIGYAMEGTSGPLPGFEQPDPTPPKVIVTVVLDGGGWNTLQMHPTSWPNLARMRRGGTTYTNATIGSAPSITGALHATFGTGVYPVTHGIPGNQMRGPDGENTDTWRDNADPSFLQTPSLADEWDRANDNDAVIATVSYEGWHLGMIGMGANYEGGDKDIAVLWDKNENAWWINEDFYSLPPYLAETDLERLETYENRLDGRDGLDDGTWFGHTVEEIRKVNPNTGEALTRPGPPSFVRFTGDAVVEIMNRESFGADDVTDFYWVEMKMPDFAGHLWNVENPEEADVLAETDAQIGRLWKAVERKVGRGNYIFAVSADHGQQPLPDDRGGWRIIPAELERDIEVRFGNVLEKVTPVDVYFDAEALEQNDVDLDEVVRWLSTYTIGDNIAEDKEGREFVPEARLDDLLFAGAFTSDFLSSLTDDEIDSYGNGDYLPHGELTRPPGKELTQVSIP